ncbi:MAG: NusG domain II-containing protein [Lachnospiraceae bacterium]
MIKNNDKKRNDLFLGAVLFLAAAVLFLGQHVFREKGVLSDYGEIRIREFSLSEDRRFLSEKNILCISDGAAFMKWADCPDQLCVHQGRSRKGRSLPVFPTG